MRATTTGAAPGPKPKPRPVGQKLAALPGNVVVLGDSSDDGDVAGLLASRGRENGRDGKDGEVGMNGEGNGMRGMDGESGPVEGDGSERRNEGEGDAQIKANASTSTIAHTPPRTPSIQFQPTPRARRASRGRRAGPSAPLGCSTHASPSLSQDRQNPSLALPRASASPSPSPNPLLRPHPVPNLVHERHDVGFVEISSDGEAGFEAGSPAVEEISCVGVVGGGCVYFVRCERAGGDR
ncbi:hypothetical protein FA13DRAFT_1094465 [Coprinellus micaceus]|uniref:Uncharacterized protein n=1 Tax=Coprinellus micaceus TaxID=71717 RepID=A0A4Y7TU10_COPMI|nr:hypothetical protein FA13DRAFT_1094465 [Coprinellus micaceus]